MSNLEEHLDRAEMECIYRHLKMFISNCWQKEKNVPDACEGCNHYCDKDIHVLNPWPTFAKIERLTHKSTEEN